MYSKTPPYKLKKRPQEESSSERQAKLPYKVAKIEDDALEEKFFHFSILLPNSTTVELKMAERRNEIPIEEFVDLIKKEYYIAEKQRRYPGQKRRIDWKYQDIHFTDAKSRKLRLEVNLRNYMPNMPHFLWLNDGSAEPDIYEGMWDLTPYTDLLKELPDDYTFETALADLIDNSLQALWSNGKGEKRIISVRLYRSKITIFDSGPGMDGANGNLVKWGKMGASLHRSMRVKAVGCEPPYLMPFFGMFGYGGPIATMCLGKRAVISSKTKNCDKVFILHLEREALVNASRSENCWRTGGGIRDPTEGEKEKSPHGSFTKVEIYEPRVKKLDIRRIQYKLKDIYFPYIQCDEVSGKTSTPVEFQVNGEFLANLEGGEVAITNLHSCNGPDFVVQLHFKSLQESSSIADQNQTLLFEANARLKCVYFPIVKGEESINTILGELDEDGCGNRESFESFSRVSVRRLGRLLPDIRWPKLPFMEPKPIKGEKGHSLKRNCSRVKCFIDTDSGFNPTPHKTDLAQHHPYTKALKNFGNTVPKNESDVLIEIYRDKKKLNIMELEKQYKDWISEMHDRYDEEINDGIDTPTIVVVTSKIKKLDTTAEVVRVHKEIKRKGKYWRAGQHIKVLKGACAGCHNNNVFATLEYIILEGLKGDACGEARLICRPFGIPESKGCHLSVENVNNTIDIRDSLVLPIRVIDSEKCVYADDEEWGKKLEAHNQKLPSSIDLLSETDCQELEIEGALPTLVQAGDAPPKNIVAVIRPKSFTVKNSSNRLDQRFIVRDDLEMTLIIKRQDSERRGKPFHVFSTRLSPTSHKGIHGLYLLPLREKIPDQFLKAGTLLFLFSLKEPADLQLERVVKVQPSAEVDRWGVVGMNKDDLNRVRVGSFLKTISVSCYDRYDNCVPFGSMPKLNINLTSNGIILAEACSKNVDITPDNSTIRIKKIVVESRGLDAIRPNYEATLDISSVDKAFSVSFPCTVIPGTPEKITLSPPTLKKKLIPGQIMEELVLEVFDEYGNHVQEDETIILKVEGFSFQDRSGTGGRVVTDCRKKVDADGFVDLSNTLKVSQGYGRDVFLSVLFEEEVIFKQRFETVVRELRPVEKVFNDCAPGSLLENIVFEITDSHGKVDESIHDEEKHGQSHTLKIKSNSFEIDDTVRYSFRRGSCTIRSIPLPQQEGTFSISAEHSRYPELNSVIKVHVKNAREEHHERIRNDESMENLVYSDQRPCENIQTPSLSPPLKISQETHGTFSPLSPKSISFASSLPGFRTPKVERAVARNENSTPLRARIPASQDLTKITGVASGYLEELENELLKSGMARNDRVRELEILEGAQSQIEQEISAIQGGGVLNTCDRVSMVQKIKSKSESPAAIVCKFLEETPARPRDVLGVVAVLGTVHNIELSRVLARYLGEDQMLAIVCRNYAAACHLEANVLGQYHAVCLDDIRPRFTEPSLDPLQPLPLETPKLPNGNVPGGFLGYAVNMMDVEETHIRWRTGRGYGLRETLFYCLFGELQVYRNRESMISAKSCIKDGAVSLDGCSMKGNGLVSLGNWQTPEILFPVRNRSLSPKSVRDLQEKRLILEEMNKLVDKKREDSRRACEKLVTIQEMYNRAMYSSSASTSSSKGYSQPL